MRKRDYSANACNTLVMLVMLLSGFLRSSHPEVFLRKGVLKIYSKFTWEHPCRSVISIKLQSNFIEITLRHGCSLVNLLHIFRKPFLRSTSGWLLLNFFQGHWRFTGQLGRGENILIRLCYFHSLITIKILTWSYACYTVTSYFESQCM